MPAAFNRKVTTEIDDAPLEVLEGALPADLAGHVLFQSLSLLPGDAGFSGDGMVWRLDFDGPTPRITSRLLRTTDYIMGAAFADTSYRFESRGMARLGSLGMQNQCNTALVGLHGNRLVATADGGRPWEIDPATLNPITPVGALDEYRPVVDLPFNRHLCPLTITSAHPPFDAETGEFYGVSLSTVPIPGLVFFEVLAWDGQGRFKRVPVVTGDGRPLLVSQNAHQICVTRHHLVILDASGTIEAGKLLHPPNSWEAGFTQVPRPESYLYVISRDDIRQTAGGVVTQRAIVPRESGHFMVDYDSTPDRLVIHSAHTSASDFAEWIQPYDIHPHTRAPNRTELINAITPVNYDIGVVGRYEVDARTGAVLEQNLFYDDWTWGTGGLVARNPLTPAATLGDVFHATSGFPTDLAVDRVARGFWSHPYRIVAIDELPWDGVPSGLVRVDHDAGRVVDAYPYPGDRFGWTPTFVPRAAGATGSDDGYVVTVVFGDEATERSSGTEMWIFRADDLASGPVVKLGRADLAVPLTLHSIWLETTRTTRPDYRIDVRRELTERAASWQLDPLVASILETEVLQPYEAMAS
ncbi:MAG: carotenoid oxygenase family protein [Microthrixaceae bacterium]|nr:carotenoid oxygenase family protein [Microthrixaceae bacterium]